MTSGPSDPAATAGVARQSGTPEEDLDKQSSCDDRALALRERGRSFSSIARHLGLEGATQANAAFNRALRRRPAGEQEALRSHETARLDALGERLRQRDDLDEVEMARRAKALERLRRSLTA